MGAEVTAPEQRNTTDGMTTKVVKGSFWVLVGQVVPLIATFIASPFVIRYLGSEAYGVLLLIAMIPGYFTFADFGMNLASTKFGSEAYGDGLPDKEAIAIRTATYIAFCSVLLIAIPMFIFSRFIINDIFRVPAKYIDVASIGLKLTTIAFFFNSLSAVINTPQLSRLKMNLNVLINAGPRILMTTLAPVVLYFDFGIKGASLLACSTALVILLLNILVSGRLLPRLFSFSIDQTLIKPLMNFGQSIVLYAIALMFIINMEKMLLPRIMHSPKYLAYYSVAFTLANMTNMFSLAMAQTLLPAFSQLLTPEKKAHLKVLFSRCLRISLIGLIPSIMVLLVIAKPFFTKWAGEEFGRESTIPFYILLVGVFFSLIVYVPNTILIAIGKSRLFAKYYMLEIIPYTLLVYLFIKLLGVMGAAIAWTIKEIVNSLAFMWFTKKYTGLTIKLHKQIKGIILGFLSFLPCVLFALFYDNFSSWLLLLLPLSGVLYLVVVWRKLIDDNERAWIMVIWKKLINR
jgi:O-antigen/teichoic acid export membrane protein